MCGFAGPVGSRSRRFEMAPGLGKFGLEHFRLCALPLTEKARQIRNIRKMESALLRTMMVERDCLLIA
jgi:hypothetical protein